MPTAGGSAGIRYPTVSPITMISSARTAIPARAAVRSRPLRGLRAPVEKARPTPASSANSAAESPANSSQDSVGRSLSG